MAFSQFTETLLHYLQSSLTGLRFVFCSISQHYRAGLKASVPAGTEFLEVPTGERAGRRR
jgi:hypothetical protein